MISIGYCQSAAQGHGENNFKTILSKHLKAISERNLDDIISTIADSVTLIFPDGEMLTSKQSFIDFHKEWFKDPTWKMTTTTLSTSEGKELSYGLVKYRFTKGSADGATQSQSDTYLLLVFKRQKNGWKLIHDQNTRIEI